MRAGKILIAIGLSGVLLALSAGVLAFSATYGFALVGLALIALGRPFPRRPAIAAGAITGAADGDRFHADIAEVVHTRLNEAATMLVVEWWTPTRGLRRIERQ